MALSNDLISQFVKATKDEPTEVKESVVYGTVQEDTRYVKLDGSDILTPVSTTTVVGKGDRVTVMIKNHTATITGNVSNPSARQVDTLSVDKLDVIYGEIDTLKVADITIQNKLTANAAGIETLQVDNVTIKNTLSAHEANIETLSADNVTISGKVTANEAAIQSLISGTATIESLNAIKADIKLLTADIADINTLIFGSASGNVIQTLFANAVIEQVGDAQIDSAMIKSVSASKITAGDIITNNVRVMSEDGSLVISDETLQISDGSRVRVQIGKDASNDYSINIWDQNGNLMFSKGGITDAAIKEAIIRNDMVSDTANIHASKLDIDSLFEEINDSSNTIKSTKIYLNDEGQTLDVAFKSLTTEVTDQGETISSQGTAISTIQGQISSKIWQQDINTAKNEMSTQYSTLEQNLGSFKTTVGNSYATKNELASTESKISNAQNSADAAQADIDNLQVGGRNLFGFNKGIAVSALGNTAYSSIALSREINGFTITTKQDAPSGMIIGRAYYLGFNGQAGESYTFSGMISANIDDVVVFLDICDKGSVSYHIGTAPQKISFSAVPTNYYNGSEYNGFFDVTVGDGMTIPSGTILYFENVKIERGNRASDWSPAPEDVEAKIVANTTLIEQTAEDLTVLIESSAKTATNYLNFSSSGLIIGDMTADTLGKNVLIDSDSVDIRNGSTTLASFGSDYLYLAKNSRDAKIDLCNGLAEMYHEIDTKGYSVFNIDTTYGLSYIKMSAPMHDLLVLENTNSTNGVIIKGMINGTTVGGFGLLRDGNMVRYGSDADDDNPVENIVLDTGNFLTEMDDGWHYTGGYGENFTQYNNEEYAKARYRKIGGMVEIRGVMRPTMNIDGSTTQYELFQLPEGYRPDSYIYQRCSGSYAYTWLLTISPSGKASFSRYGDGSSYVDVDTTAWLPFQITYFVD